MIPPPGPHRTESTGRTAPTVLHPFDRFRRAPALLVALVAMAIAMTASGAFFVAADAAAPGGLWAPLASPTRSDLRGVSAPAPLVAWASGTRGTYLRTSDGGKSWAAAVVPGADALDFRDVEAFDSLSAILMGAGPGPKSRIYRTGDGGAHWELVLENPDPNGFFDAIAFWDRGHGLVLGDPVDGRFVLFATSDGGAHWNRIPSEGLPPALPGEGAFAASGTCLAVLPDGHAWFGTGGGGGSGRVFRSDDHGHTWRTASSGIAASNASSGVFSLAFRDARHGIAVGGDYRVPAGSSPSIARTEDGGATWSAVPVGTLNPYYSAVSVVPATDPTLFVAVGPAAFAWSSDGGRTWSGRVSAIAYNALAFSGRKTGWSVGPGGNLGSFADPISSGGPGVPEAPPSPDRPPAPGGGRASR